MNNTLTGKNIKLKNFDTTFTEIETNTALMYLEVVESLSKPQKELPCKYFYDEKGSRLFDKICMLDEYYLTRTELDIMRHNINDISDCLGNNIMLIEYGSGSSEKTKVILDNIKGTRTYIPVDISMQHLVKSATLIAARYPDLEVIPLCEDYNRHFELPRPDNKISSKIVYFPGSTIGNFHPPDAQNFMKRIADTVDEGGGLLIGVDLKKDKHILERAYNDAAGVTAEFNLNQLHHINSKLAADFNTGAFEHKAIYNEKQGRIEMHLVSLEEQHVKLNGTLFRFDKGETIWTESSYKYSLEEFAGLAKKSGFKVERIWTDNDFLFSVQFLRASGQK